MIPVPRLHSGPAQSTVLSNKQPNGPTCWCNAINFSNTVLGDP